MGEIVVATGMPHTPSFPELVEREPNGVIARHYRTLSSALQRAAVDVLAIFGCDHINAFFLDHWPTFCIGTGLRSVGPGDGSLRGTYEVPIADGLARHIYAGALDAGFDVSIAHEPALDHAFLIPLRFLTPRLDVPVVPIVINGIVPPLPRADRCHAFGRVIAACIDAWPKTGNVGLVSSGSFSLESAGPHSVPGQLYGIPDPEWARRVAHLLRTGDLERLVAEAEPARTAAAGNVAGELLAWITMAGALSDLQPVHVEYEPGDAHAFALWERLA